MRIPFHISVAVSISPSHAITHTPQRCFSLPGCEWDWIHTGLERCIGDTDGWMDGWGLGLGGDGMDELKEGGGGSHEIRESDVV